MDAMFLPVIEEKDFEAFSRLEIRDFPPSYAEAKQRHINRLAYHGATHRIVEVHVDPDQFSRFVDARRKTYNLGALLDFAAAKGRGEL